MSTTTVKRGQRLQRRRTGVVRVVNGFTTKPSKSSPTDGVRRARMVDPVSGDESRVRVDQIHKTYRPVA